MDILKVSITQQDIDEGRRSDCGYCPVALALRRLGFKNISVTLAVTQWDNGDKWKYAMNPTPVKEFILKFDKTGTGDPFEFEFFY